MLLVFVLTCVAILLAVNAQQASSATYTTCTLSSSDKKPNRWGPSYLRKLKVKNGPTCAGGKNLVKLFYNCRTEGPKGDTGRCTHRISGYTCNESRTNVIPTQFDASVTCAKGSRRVFHRYTQLVN